jgi:hypothetical protein
VHGRERVAQSPAGGADLGNRPQDTSVQWPNDESLDDSNTMLIELRHISEAEGVITPAWWSDRGTMLPGQLAADTYSMRKASDGTTAAGFRGQVSQRPIAIHGLEHLGTTDRGITMFRNQIRAGLRAVKPVVILLASSALAVV